tara:strand:+ start:1048 stop:1266 length:219 start_codon:yes stop_codon:yes gene_type:complete
MKDNKVRIHWSSQDQIEFYVKDMSRRVMYKAKFNVNNEKKLAEALSYLDKYGIDISNVAKIIEKKRKKGWFS